MHSRQNLVRVGCSNPPEVDRLWLWVCYNKVPVHRIFYLLKGDYQAVVLHIKLRLKPRSLKTHKTNGP